MFEFQLPDVGEGVAEGELIEWHVAPGDTVAEDEVLAEVETDKAVVDLPSPVAGTIVELHAEPGEVVPVGEVVVTIDTGEEAAEDATVDPEPDGTEAPADPDDTDAESASGGDGSTGGRVFAPPNVRRLARELGVDIAAVDGSGPGGRVTEADVRDAAGGSDDGTAPTSAVEPADETTAAVSRADDASEAGDDSANRKSAVRKVTDSDGPDAATAADRERTLAVPATRRVAREEGVDIDAVPTEKTRDGEAFVDPEDVRAYAEAQQRAQAADTAAVADTGTAGDGSDSAETADETVGTTATAAGDVTREPYRGIRRTIGQRMEESAYTAPHVSHHDTAVVDALVETRAELKPRAAQRDVRLTYLPFVMKAVVAGLKEFPVLNTTLDEENEEIVYKHFYNLGVAVATDAGLMVPVVENVDGKSILQLAAETNELAERARDRDLAREEMQGGTFSLTNFGAIGGEYATPIINYPETAILGLGSIEQRPTVQDGEVVASHTLPLSLSIDHRVIDGAEAARFVNTVIEYLEAPRLLLLD